MLDFTRREFIGLVGGGGLLLAAKVKRARGQQPAMPVIGLQTHTGCRLRVYCRRFAAGPE